MKKLLISIPVAIGLIFTSCSNVDFSQQTDYNQYRSVDEKSPSGGGKVHYPDVETGYIRDHDGEGNFHPYELNKGTNQQTRDVKEPMPWPMGQIRIEGPSDYND